MVDRRARDELAQSLRHLASGSLTLTEFSDNYPKDSDDQVIAEVAAFCVALFEDLEQRVMFERIHNNQPDPELKQMETLRFKGDYALTRQQRRRFAQLILFLHSDREYEWSTDRETSMRLKWWQAILLTPVLIIGCLFCAVMWGALAEATNPVVGVLVFAGIGTVIHALFGDERYWPFRRRKDYKTALANPRLLSGRS